MLCQHGHDNSAIVCLHLSSETLKVHTDSMVLTAQIATLRPTHDVSVLQASMWSERDICVAYPMSGITRAPDNLTITIYHMKEYNALQATPRVWS